jgi:hypothetical protein
MVQGVAAVSTALPKITTALLPTTVGYYSPIAAVAILRLTIYNSMYYWTCILHLFRPFLKYELQSSDILPMHTCRHAAKQIRTIMDSYRQRFTLRCGNLLPTNLILSICTVHLLDLPQKGNALSKKSQLNLEAEENISKGLRDLAEISRNHNFAARCFKIICSLAEKWGVHIPEHVFNTSTPILAHNAIASPTLSSFHGPAIAMTSAATGGSLAASLEQVQRRNSMTMNLTLNDNARFSRQQNEFSAEQPNSFAPSKSVQDTTMGGTSFPPYTSSTTSSTYAPAIQHVTPSVNSSFPPTSPTSVLSGASTMQPSQSKTTPPAAFRENFFWTPFPGEGIPLINNNVAVDHPMDISSILGHVSEFEQFNRDGFIRISSQKEDALHSDTAAMYLGPQRMETAANNAPRKADSRQHGAANTNNGIAQQQHTQQTGATRTRAYPQAWWSR